MRQAKVNLQWISTNLDAEYKQGPESLAQLFIRLIHHL